MSTAYYEVVRGKPIQFLERSYAVGERVMVEDLRNIQKFETLVRQGKVRVVMGEPQPDDAPKTRKRAGG